LRPRGYGRDLPRADHAPLRISPRHRGAGGARAQRRADRAAQRASGASGAGRLARVLRRGDSVRALLPRSPIAARRCSPGPCLGWYVSANTDFLVAGRILGKTALGFYNVAWTLASVPVDKVAALVGQVTPAFFSAVQTDRPAMRRYLLRITEGIALITFPVSLGLVLVARDFVLVVLGSKWEGTIAPLRLLAAYATL